MITVGVITDVHFGPNASFDGQLRKLSHLAPELTARFAARMRDEVRPDFVVNLGDAIEDESPEADRKSYKDCIEAISACDRPVVHVAGNHDRIHLGPADLRAAWGMAPEGPLYRSFDRGGVHFVVLYTHEHVGDHVEVGAEQLRWLAADLAATALPTVVWMHHSAADQELRGNRWFERAAHLCLVRDRRPLRELLSRHRRTLAVINGHLHWNHLDVIDGLPFITLQSLIENVHDGAPGEPAAAHAVVRITPRRLVVEVAGAQPARYQIERSP